MSQNDTKIKSNINENELIIGEQKIYTKNKRFNNKVNFASSEYLSFIVCFKLLL